MSFVPGIYTMTIIYYSLKKIQRRAAQWVCSDYNLNTSVTTLLSQLFWQTLQDRRKYAKLTLLHNTIHAIQLLKSQTNTNQCNLPPEILITFSLSHI